MSWDVNLGQAMPNGMWPMVNQLNSPTDDGGQDENSIENCGEANVCSIARFVAGVVVEPDWVKDIILRQNATGPTNDHQLHDVMTNRLGVPSTLYYPSDMGVAMAIIRSYIRDQRPVICLRYFGTIGGSAAHWETVFGGNGPDDTHTAQLYVADPWGGIASVESNTTFWSWLMPYPTASTRCLIGIDRYRSVITSG